MDSNKYTQYLLDNIKPFAKKASGGKVVNCRCFYCPDSKNNSKGHFYISIPNNDEPSLFYCQKCHASGMVTQKQLLEWDLYDINIVMDLSSYNKKILKLSKNLKFKDSQIYRIINNYISDDKLSQYKLNYINNRIGTHLDYHDCISNKIVLNLNDILTTNHLQLTRHPNIAEQLDTNFVGFLSYDNAFLNMRNLNLNKVHESIDKRYVNYNLFNKYDNTHRFYIIPNEIDLLRPITLHIAEGPFDILSIYHNLRKVLDNNIYISISGNGYKGIIRYLITNMKLINLETHIYADNDIERYKMIQIANLLKPFNMNIFLHRNVYPGEKDFGVDVNRIQESIEKIN